MADRFCVPIGGSLVQDTRCVPTSIPLALRASPFGEGSVDFSIYSGARNAEPEITHGQASVGALVLGAPRRRVDAPVADLVESSRTDGKVCQPKRRIFVKAIGAGAPRSPNPNCAEIATVPATDCHALVTPQVFVAAVRLRGACAAAQKPGFHQAGKLGSSAAYGLWTVYSRLELSERAKSAHRRGSFSVSLSGIAITHG